MVGDCVIIEENSKFLYKCSLIDSKYQSLGSSILQNQSEKGEREIDAPHTMGSSSFAEFESLKV